MELVADFQHAARGLRRSPAFTAAAVAVLTLGIGANTAVFSVVQAVVLRPLPIPEPGRAVVVTETVRRDTVERRSVSYPDFLDWRAARLDDRDLFELITAYATTSFTLGGTGEPLRIETELVSPSYFPLLGARPALGRTFRTEEDAPGAGPVVVLSDALWRQRFGADAGVVGGPARLDERVFTVIGVMPPSFAGISGDAQAWVPVSMVPDAEGNLGERGRRWHDVIARLAPGVSLERAQAALSALARAAEHEYPETNENYGALVVPLDEELRGNLRPAALTLLAAVGFVLLIACANLAHLLLARATARRRQTAVMAALGAGRGRLVRQALAEGVLLAGLGGLAGVLVAVWAAEALVRFSPVALPSLAPVELDAAVLAFTLASALACGLLVAAAPAVQVSGVDLESVLREAGRSAAAGLVRGRARSLMMVGEVAVATLLLVGAGLAIESFLRMRAIDPGFRTEGLLTAQVSLPEGRYEPAAAARFAERLLERVRALPGVESAALASDIPLGGDSDAALISPEGRRLGTLDNAVRIYRHAVTPGFFATAGVPLLRGRDFGREDAAEAPLAVVVSQRLGQRIWGAGDPLGRRIKFGGEGSDRPWMTVVGVAAEVRHRALVPDPERTPGDPDLYLPLAQNPGMDLGVLARTAVEPTTLPRQIAREVAALDPEVPLYEAATMEELASGYTALARFGAALMGVFGGVAVLLAALGIYALLSYSVAGRRHEIGVRMALGAVRGRVLGMVMGEGLGFSLAGLALGLLAARFAAGLLASQLYGVRPLEPGLYLGLAATLLGVAALATAIPALRAMRVDPAATLQRG